MLYLLRELKLINLLAICIHFTHKYLARSNYDCRKRTKILLTGNLDNLLLDGASPNIFLKLLADFSIILLFVISIKPILDSTRPPFIAVKS